MKKIITGALLLSPMFAFGAGGITGTITTVQGVINSLVPLLMALAVVAFFWGLVKYIANADDEAAKESGKTLMIWGMVAIFVMVAFWGIIGYFQTSLGLTGSIDPGTAPSMTAVIPV